MSPRWRLISVLSMVVAVTVITWLIVEHATPGQPASLSVIVDGGTEALRTIDRIGKFATQISVEEEIRLGNDIAIKIGPSLGATSTGYQDAYVQAVVDTLVSSGGLRRPDIPYVANVVPSSVANAYALPGGHVFITTGMLGLLETETELAAIMGHEIAHVDLKHCIERIQYEQVAKKIGGAPVQDMIGIGSWLLTVGFSDELEADADRKGMIYAERAGYHPQGGQLAFSRLKALYEGHEARRDSMGREVGGMIKDALGDYFGSHPKSDERIRLFERTIEQQRWQIDRQSYYVGRRNYDDLTARSTKDYSSEMFTGRIYPSRP